jgi:hypothetical protein
MCFFFFFYLESAKKTYLTSRRNCFLGFEAVFFFALLEVKG